MPVKNRRTPLGPTTTLARSHSYSSQAMALFDELYPQVLLEFVHDAQDPNNFEGEVLVGRRTMNQTDVEMTLKCGVSEVEFLAEPLTKIYDAIQACAEKDWAYAEKYRGDLRSIRESEGIPPEEVARVVED